MLSVVLECGFYIQYFVVFKVVYIYLLKNIEKCKVLFVLYRVKYLLNII